MNSIFRVFLKPRCINKFNYSTISDSVSKSIANNVLSKEEIELEVEEIRIPLPFGGHLAGKWWGDKSIRPIVCIHGWQDNAGSYDRLIPLLPRDRSYLAIDYPGCGYSSWLPAGCQYHDIDNALIIKTLVDEYKWEKVGFISHSMGSIGSFLYASAFPSKVEFLVGIDNLKPPVMDPVGMTQSLGSRIENFTLTNIRNQDESEPPSYTIEDLSERMFKGTQGSVTKECAPILLKRNVKQSEKHPGKFYFSRDGRMKFSFRVGYPQTEVLEHIKKIQMPYLVIKVKNSPLLETKNFHMEALEIFKTTNKHFEYQVVDSTHHVQLTEPEKISGMISDFILKHKKEPSKN